MAVLAPINNLPSRRFSIVNDNTSNIISSPLNQSMEDNRPQRNNINSCLSHAINKISLNQSNHLFQIKSNLSPFNLLDKKRMSIPTSSSRICDIETSHMGRDASYYHNSTIDDIHDNLEKHIEMGSLRLSRKILELKSRKKDKRSVIYKGGRRIWPQCRNSPHSPYQDSIRLPLPSLQSKGNQHLMNVNYYNK